MANSDILRSLVRIRLEGDFFLSSYNKELEEKRKKILPRVRLELTTFRSLFRVYIIMRLTRCRLRYRGMFLDASHFYHESGQGIL